jgi:hypothetical protein
MSAMARASLRKSSSARRLRANWPSTSPELGHQGERRQVPLHHLGDVGALDLDHDDLAGGQAGHVGLADGGGRQRRPVEVGEHLLHRPAQLGFDHLPDAVGGFGRHPVGQAGQLGADVRRQQVDPGGGDLAELDVDAARLLQHAAQPHAHRLGLPLGPAPGGRPRAEALGPQQAQQLSIAADHVDPPPHGPQRPGGDQQPRLGRLGQRPGPGQQVEGDGDGHGRGHGDGQGLDDQALGAPVPVVEPQGQQAPHQPAGQPGGQCLRPAPAHAQQPQGQRGGGDGERRRHDDADGDLGEVGSEHRHIRGDHRPVSTPLPYRSGRRGQTGAGLPFCRCAP